MIVRENEPLKKYTTFGMGGPTPKMYIPENEQELLDLIISLNKRKESFSIIGNGSNLLITEKPLRRSIILNRKACNYMHFQDEGLVEIGASVRLQVMISKLIKENLEAPVALLTIPATVGGAIFMNAARASFDVSISDCLQEVRYFDGKEVKTISHDSCAFNWRSSVFQRHRDWVILSAKFQFKPQPSELSATLKKESLEAAKGKTYLKFKSAGSVFKTKHLPYFKRLKGLRFGDVEYSKTTPNTFHNLGEAKLKDVMKLIFITKAMHYISFKKCLLENEIWKN